MLVYFNRTGTLCYSFFTSITEINKGVKVKIIFNRKNILKCQA